MFIYIYIHTTFIYVYYFGLWYLCSGDINQLIAYYFFPWYMLCICCTNIETICNKFSLASSSSLCFFCFFFLNRLDDLISIELWLLSTHSLIHCHLHSSQSARTPTQRAGLATMSHTAFSISQKQAWKTSCWRATTNGFN